MLVLSINVCAHPFSPKRVLIRGLSGSWEESYNLANAIVQHMTLDEKIGIVTGTGQLNSSRWYCAFRLHSAS
jgi:hypothetical protein